jgi:hypothetical protein
MENPHLVPVLHERADNPPPDESGPAHINTRIALCVLYVRFRSFTSVGRSKGGLNHQVAKCLRAWVVNLTYT